MHGASVLIVEDDPALLRGLKDNFEAQHYRVQLARDGREHPEPPQSRIGEPSRADERAGTRSVIVPSQRLRDHQAVAAVLEQVMHEADESLLVAYLVVNRTVKILELDARERKTAAIKT